MNPGNSPASRALLAALCGATLLAGCAGNMSGSDSTPEEASRAAYRHDGPPAITLYTMINNRTGSGAHSSIMVNAPSQRVIFDPAGSVRFSSVPEIDDVLYGVSPEVEQMYASAHARETYRVRIQRKEVSPEVAQQALRMVQAYGAVPAAQCARSTSTILSRLPGFQGVQTEWYPNKLAASFARLPGVTERELRENDDDDKALAIAAFENRQVVATGN